MLTLNQVEPSSNFVLFVKNIFEGHKQKQKIINLFGECNNGKSTLINALQEAFPENIHFFNPYEFREFALYKSLSTVMDFFVEKHIYILPENYDLNYRIFKVGDIFTVLQHNPNIGFIIEGRKRIPNMNVKDIECPNTFDYQEVINYKNLIKKELISMLK